MWTFPRRKFPAASPSGSPAIRPTLPAYSPSTPNWSPAPAKAPSPVSEPFEPSLICGAANLGCRRLSSRRIRAQLGPLLALLLAAVAAPAAQPSVTIYRDTYAVPHIYARTAPPLVFAPL